MVVIAVRSGCIHLWHLHDLQAFHFPTRPSSHTRQPMWEIDMKANAAASFCDAGGGAKQTAAARSKSQFQLPGFVSILHMWLWGLSAFLIASDQASSTATWQLQGLIDFDEATLRWDPWGFQQICRRSNERMCGTHASHGPFFIFLVLFIAHLKTRRACGLHSDSVLQGHGCCSPACCVLWSTNGVWVHDLPGNVHEQCSVTVRPSAITTASTTTHK